LEVIVVEGGFYNRFNIVLNIMFAKKESQVLLQEIAKMREIMFSTMTYSLQFHVSIIPQKRQSSARHLYWVKFFKKPVLSSDITSIARPIHFPLVQLWTAQPAAPFLSLTTSPLLCCLSQALFHHEGTGNGTSFPAIRP